CLDLYPAVACFTILFPSPSDVDTLSLHDALPICALGIENVVGDLEGEAESARIAHQRLALRLARLGEQGTRLAGEADERARLEADRKSTRLNSSHVKISYAVFCLKKKTK